MDWTPPYERVELALRLGMNIRQVAELAGIARSTVGHYIQLGATATEGPLARIYRARQAGLERCHRLGRSPYTKSVGDANPQHKLTAADIPVILEAIHQGAGIRGLARAYGVGEATMSNAAHGLTWGHVPCAFPRLPRPPQPFQRLTDAFWAHVERSASCWFWRGRVTDQGAPILYFQRRHYLARQLCWFLHTGERRRQMPLSLTCQQPLCVRFEHLRTPPLYSHTARRQGDGAAPVNISVTHPEKMSANPGTFPRYHWPEGRRRYIHVPWSRHAPRGPDPIALHFIAPLRQWQDRHRRGLATMHAGNAPVVWVLLGQTWLRPPLRWWGIPPTREGPLSHASLQLRPEAGARHERTL